MAAVVEGFKKIEMNYREAPTFCVIKLFSVVNGHVYAHTHLSISVSACIITVLLLGRTLTQPCTWAPSLPFRWQHHLTFWLPHPPKPLQLCTVHTPRILPLLLETALPLHPDYCLHRGLFSSAAHSILAGTACHQIAVTQIKEMHF